MLWLPAFAAAQESPTETPAVEAGLTVHIVQRGENLFRIALQYGLTVDQIAQFNGITNPASITVGQRILIPLNGQTQAATPEPQIHVVRAGESLVSIAAVYGLAVDQLAQFNGITDPDTIFVGQVLTIAADPLPATALPPAPVAAATREAAAPGSAVTHIVQPGETLFRIATLYGLTVDDLQQANAISEAALIYAGQELVIPLSGPTPVAYDLPPEITGIDLAPLRLVEGQTARLRLTTAEAASVTITFLARAMPIISDGTTHIAFLPIPLGTAGGVQPIEVIAVIDGAGSLAVPINVQITAGSYGMQSIILPDDRVPLLAAGVEQNELNILQNVVRTFNPERYFDGPMSLPAAAVMNSPYGTTRSYNGGPFDRRHLGADFAGAPGSPVLAAAGGRVVLADTLNIRGLSVVIDHGWGIYTNYSHLSERYVNLGDSVTSGQVIGTVGSTGRATGAHLHWELWVNGVAVDPMQWVRQAFP
jgi:murein DD-endopeptidase MepM/ murein hydrolase activator NlpD